MATEKFGEDIDVQIQLNKKEDIDTDGDDIEEKQDQGINITDDMFLAEGARREIGSMVWIQRVADINLAAETFFCNFAIELYVYTIQSLK